MGKPNVNINVGGAANGTQTYKIVVLKSNIPFVQQISSEDTIYVIKWDYDLGGEEVSVPTNCVLKFEGGSVNNGIMYLNGCDIVPTFNSVENNSLVLNGYPKAGVYKWDRELGKPLWCNGEKWVDAMGNPVEVEQENEEVANNN